MKTKFMLIVAFVVMRLIGSGQDVNLWDQWTWLMGEWQGEGTGQPGQGGGTFSFSTDLDGKILVRKSHSEYPATDNKPLIKHDDLLIVYSDYPGSPTKAIYFDNEGHTINYTAFCSDRSIVLLSAKISDMPVFRLTYTLLDSKEVNTKFEISKDGENFITYIEGQSIKIN